MNTGDPKMDGRSIEKLRTVHPSLQHVIQEAADDHLGLGVKFIVTEGIRTKERQKQLVKAGASRTMQSKHLEGRAVDLAVVVGDEVRWDWPLYRELARLVKDAAERLEIPIVWGGDWVTFKDGPHFELHPNVK